MRSDTAVNDFFPSLASAQQFPDLEWSWNRWHFSKYNKPGCTQDHIMWFHWILLQMAFVWLADTAQKKSCPHLFWLQRCIQHSRPTKQTTQQPATFKKYSHVSFWKKSCICSEDVELQVNPRACSSQYCYCYLCSGYLRNCKRAVSWMSGLDCSKYRQTHQQK